MKECWDAQHTKSESKPVTYVVVVHGIGEQRENETVLQVVNRFAEARRCARANDNRDVLTLGKATEQTGLSNVHTTGQPWMEFEGIPADPNASPTKIFLGEESSTGKNLRFVDLCWADILRKSYKHVGQDTEVWTKGLLGRLLRKHEDAKGNNCARVPFWIRRALYLLADTLLLVRFAMNFRFKEMKELVFVKYLGDVQVYGEYDRCRGLAVRHFHETMAKIEAEHKRREPQSEHRYVIIAHSLGSILSFDALLYAHAPTHVRCGKDPDWVFPGYLPDGVTDNEKYDLCRLDKLRARKDANRGALSEAETTALQYLEKKFTFPKTGWIERVQSFVTLGSPIDKYLMLWWLNYRYLLNHREWFKRIASKTQTCSCRGPGQKSPINHFNYCDELDPVGHNLDVAHETLAYKAVFKCCEDIVFNRYAVPGAAHNKYWTDQELFGWILDRAVDRPGQDPAGQPPRWFSLFVYFKLLIWLYCAVPFLVLVGTYASLSVAFQASDWRTAAMAAGGFSFLAYFGRRLIDLGIWWRQIQRQESEFFWERDATGNDSGQKKTEQPCDSDGPDPKQRCCRRWASRLFRIVVTVVPIAWAAVALAALQPLGLSTLQGVLALLGGSVLRLTLVALVSVLVVLCLSFLCRLPSAYRVRTVDDHGACPRLEAWLLVLVCVALGSVAAPLLNQVLLPLLTRWELEQAALFGTLATIISAYQLYRFILVKRVLRCSKAYEFAYSKYARHPSGCRRPNCCCSS